ncbi:protein kinase domain-containing protein [Streptomyces sp. NBC_01477]|uniref:protein kinase domain-containing protein n=1 Tax=Streptomyces sp. NBC_01477 TaxID=2976015 RepID=UPI002E32C063|nr:protein kinase [Streptomyces sp. NBC_01477]
MAGGARAEERDPAADRTRQGERDSAGGRAREDGRGRRAPVDVPDGYRLGDWTVTGLIGSGSWGSVYTARGADGTAAAVKFLGTALLSPGQQAAMADLVRREVRFSLAAHHPHLIRTVEALTVRDPGRPDLDGCTALVMDRADRSVQDVLDTVDAGRPPPDAGRILRGAAAGLAHLHRAGWLHGDLKPANILLGPQGEVWLADFGLTAELDGTHAYVPPMGTLDHLPPEWWSARTGSQGTAVRPTADIWAYGILAHEVLCGGLHPFPGATARARALAAQSYARGAAPLRLAPSLPDGWHRLITDCLAPDHAARAGLTADGLAARVAALGPAGTRAPARSTRRQVLLPAALVGVLLAAGAGLLLTDDSRPARPKAGSGAPPVATIASVNDILPAQSDVPAALRPSIGQAARLCAEPEVTPALIAAMLKAESGFDVHARRPATDEYGVAMWTPRVFNAWAVDGDLDGRKSYMSAPDAIATMGVYLCWVDQQLKLDGMRGDLPSWIAAAYRTSVRTIVDAHGVPARVQPYVDTVRRYMAGYALHPAATGGPR